MKVPGMTMIAGMEPFLTAAIGIGVVLAVVFAVIRIWARRRRKPLPMDEMEGGEFEQYCAQLLKEHGFDEVEVTRGSGDYGVDVLAQREGITYAVQCKRYDGPVGVHAVQEVYAGKAFYDRMVGVVMTNQYFTAPAVEMAVKLQVLLWDRDYIDELAAEEHTL